METKIIKVVFGGRRYAVTNKRTRTDYGQMFEFVDIDLPETFEVIFSNSNTSAGTGKKMIGSNQRCLIPDEYLKTGQPIYAWVLVHDGEDDGRHMYSIKSPVDDMPDTSPEEPTPVEQSVISQAITALNSAVDTTSQKAQEASASADRAEHAAEGVEGYAERAEAAQSAAESARDRATQAETSARTSAATATEKASEAISSATTASRSALNAESASTVAQEYATASAESASQASQSADTASAKATEASGYASNANTSAQTASQKASEASQSASSASHAKTDAESAKTASETAQGLAEQAQTAAETAQGAAEDARNEAQEIVDGITGKVEQIDSNTDRIESLEDDRYKPYAVDTASGAVASFVDGADDIPLKSCIVQIEPVQAGSGDPSPENERPITGRTGVAVQRTGKNLFPHQNIAVYTWDFSQKYALYDAINPVFLKANTTYTLTIDSGNKLYRMRFWDAFGTLIRDYANAPMIVSGPSTGLQYYDNYKFYAYENVNPATNVCTITPVVDTWMDMVVQSTASSKNQLELGSTATSYEPYSEQTYTITFPTEAGTVYGAYVDVTGGELVVDRAMVDLATLKGWRGNMSGRNAIEIAITLNGKKVGRTNIISDMLKTGTETGAVDVAAFSIRGFPSTETIAVKAPKSVVTDVDGLSAWIGANHPMACYELATPIHYPLTPIEIKTLLGTNNIWSDCGDTEVEYRANTKLYIEKLTQPEEDDMIADSAISEGQFFMIGNSLYRALANIASGATITVGTNAQRVSLSDALNLVNA